MKNRVKFSTYSIAITAAVLLLSAVGIVSLVGETDRLVIFCVILGVAIISGLYYCPVSVEANQSGIVLNRLISRPRYFSYGEIASVDTCYPSAGGLRLCGSGGLFGYWGYFSDIMIGTYFGYYGSRSHCFLIGLTSGRQYVIGCTDPAAIVSYVEPRLSASRLCYTIHTECQYQGIVKVPGSFRPSALNEHLYSYCNFAELLVETVGKSLRHSCRSELTRQGISLP